MLVHNFPKSFISPHLKVLSLEISKGVGELQPSVLDTKELKQRRERRQRERQKANRFRLAKQQLCTWITLLVHSFSVVHDYDVKLPNFTSCGGHEHKTITFSFFTDKEL